MTPEGSSKLTFAFTSYDRAAILPAAVILTRRCRACGASRQASIRGRTGSVTRCPLRGV